jgi:hypothetical protein
MLHRFMAPTLAVLLVCGLSAQTSRQPPAQQPARDTPGQRDTSPTPSGRISGRVLAADNGRPVKRARASVSGPELPEGRATLTDDNGVFALDDLPPGRYTLTVTKTGFITLSYGQRRPLQAGTPLQLAENQQMGGLDFRLPRGSVIAGHVFDEGGDPLPGAAVRVVRYQYTQGERQLVPAGNAQSDDQGSFRIWGLNPGEYYVSAVARNFNVGPAGRGGPGGGRGGTRPGFITPPAGSADTSPDGDLQKAYAPTYFPGVGSIAEARPVSVGVSQETLDVNFNLLLVRTGRVSGIVTNPDGSASTSGQVNLTPEEGASSGGRGQIGINFGSRIDWDGTFSIANVPPGRYMLRARGNDTESPQYAVQPLTVANGDLANIAVVLFPGATISGTLTFDGSDPPDVTQIRVTAPSAEGGSIGPNPNARVDRDGRFTLDGVPAGSHWIRAGGQLKGWALKAVTVDNRDIVDAPVNLRSSQNLSNVNIVLTNKRTEINGTVTNEQSIPIPDFTVIAFSTDPTLWRPLTRHILTARPDQNGKFQLRGLPPGDYYVVTVDPAEQGEWFEPAFLDQHRAEAARIRLGDGDIKSHDFRIMIK